VLKIMLKTLTRSQASQEAPLLRHEWGYCVDFSKGGLGARTGCVDEKMRVI
jgi:hypothetical protein